MELRINQGLELSLPEKLNVLNNLRGFDTKIDFSGGDPLAISHTKILIIKAYELFGKHNVTLTATGAGLARADVNEISPFIGELNFTYDSSGRRTGQSRPRGYAKGNLHKAKQFAQVGVKTRGETPLTTDNISNEILTNIYLDLHDAEIDKHLIMRLFQSGRGVFLSNKIPSIDQYRKAIDHLYELEEKYQKPKIKLQCALKFLDPKRIHAKNPCDLVTESFGLMPDGTLLASPWAIGSIGKPLDNIWVLGNLSKNSIQEILATEKAKMFERRADENFGHCKIQAFFSQKEKREDIIFSKADPLYV